MVECTVAVRVCMYHGEFTNNTLLPNLQMHVYSLQQLLYVVVKVKSFYI